MSSNIALSLAVLLCYVLALHTTAQARPSLFVETHPVQLPSIEPDYCYSSSECVALLPLNSGDDFALPVAPLVPQLPIELNQPVLTSTSVYPLADRVVVAGWDAELPDLESHGICNVGLVNTQCWNGLTKWASGPAVNESRLVNALSSIEMKDSIQEARSVRESPVVTEFIDTVFLTQAEFMYADNPRYGFLGGTPRRVTDIQLLPTIGLALGYSALVVGLHINQMNAWWSTDRGPFHIVDDIEYARGFDKFGHFYAAYIMSRLSGDLLMECGFDVDAGTAIGAGMGLAYSLYVEFEDGFAKQWGFSPTDAIADVVGTAFYVGQQYVPFLQNFHPRSSYIPAELIGKRPINERPTTFIDDYNSLTFWISMNVNNMMPAAWADVWPDWLMVTAGYGIDNYDVRLADGSFAPVTSRFLLGLDYDLVKIIPRSSIGFINYLIQGLNIIRLPGPTLEFTPEGTRFGLFYPFAVTVHF